MHKAGPKKASTECRNGSKCAYLKRGKCLFFHPESDRSRTMTDKTRSLKSKYQELTGLCETLALKVAAMQQVLTNILNVWPDLYSKLVVDDYIATIIQQRWTVTNRTYLKSEEDLKVKLDGCLPSFSPNERELIQGALNRKARQEEKSHPTLKQRIMVAAKITNEGDIKKIWQDINPPSYLRPKTPRIKLHRLCRDLERGRIVFNLQGKKWKVAEEPPKSASIPGPKSSIKQNIPRNPDKLQQQDADTLFK